jgi:hypothetical protein
MVQNKDDLRIESQKKNKRKHFFYRFFYMS